MSYPRLSKLGGSPRQVSDALNHALNRLESKQNAIADDASGAANQATVNAILAALRAYGIIA